MSAAVVGFTATAILPYVGVQVLGSLVPSESQEGAMWWSHGKITFSVHL